MSALDTVVLTGDALSITQVVEIARNRADVALSDTAEINLVLNRRFITDNVLVDDAPLMYAFNTGVGALKNQRISAADIARFQRNLIHSHSASTGDSMPDEVVRAMMAIRVNTFARNHSGIRI